ncbi:hypothetical protein BDW22DRAFT_1354781 [Trametopsis cervina]|nr:hypothetical protein BDW22DRAFT_1354781 [Trametopsis cervina]
MASSEELTFTPAHPPTPKALEAFTVVQHAIKAALVKSRHDWDIHEPRMWARAAPLSDHELAGFVLENDLVECRSAPTSYGTIILGKIRIPAVGDAEGEGFVHVRIHDPPNRGTEDVRFHSIWTDEGRPSEDAQPTSWRAIQTRETPLEFFNE